MDHAIKFRNGERWDQVLEEALSAELSSLWKRLHLTASFIHPVSHNGISILLNTSHTLDSVKTGAELDKLA